MLSVWFPCKNLGRVHCQVDFDLVSYFSSLFAYDDIKCPLKYFVCLDFILMQIHNNLVTIFNL